MLHRTDRCITLIKRTPRIKFLWFYRLCFILSFERGPCQKSWFDNKDLGGWEWLLKWILLKNYGDFGQKCSPTHAFHMQNASCARQKNTLLIFYCKKFRTLNILDHKIFQALEFRTFEMSEDNGLRNLFAFNVCDFEPQRSWKSILKTKKRL